MTDKSRPMSTVNNFLTLHSTKNQYDISYWFINSYTQDVGGMDHV